jgi:protein-S-isoprenylcysteine O-methyltransferase Ste14
VVFLASSTATGIYLQRHDQALLERRMRAGPQAEARPQQRIIMGVLVAVFTAVVIVAGMDFRHRWSQVPAPIVISADLLIVASFVVFLLVMRENTFAAATVTVEVGQRVISSGLYAWVRHPMYAGGVLLFFAMPIALGSWWALPVAALGMPVLAARIFDEERALITELAGYEEYCRAVPYRLIPRIW